MMKDFVDLTSAFRSLKFEQLTNPKAKLPKIMKTIVEAIAPSFILSSYLTITLLAQTILCA